MIKFALKNMLTKKVKLILVLLSIVISATVAILSYNVAEQVNDGLVNTTSSYDMIVGSSGSATQLTMNTLFFTDKPLGTISYEYVEALQSDDRVNVAIPFAMGDSYNSAKIVGTKPAFLAGKDLRKGSLFENAFDAVVGYSVAQKYNLKIGDELVTSHGLSESGEKHEATPLKVVGILEQTKTAYDNVVFTDIETVWAIHEHHHEDADDGSLASQESETPLEEHAHEHEHEEEHEGHAEEGTVCAILVRSKTFAASEALKKELANDSKILTVTPAEVIREVIGNVDLSRKIVYILCLIILVMNIFVISTITILNMYDSQKDIALMRLIGIGSDKINLLFLLQNGMIGVLATAISFAFSRICLLLLGRYAATMGIVFDTSKIYPLEWLIMAVVLILLLECTALDTKSA